MALGYPPSAKGQGRFLRCPLICQQVLQLPRLGTSKFQQHQHTSTSNSTDRKKQSFHLEAKQKMSYPRQVAMTLIEFLIDTFFSLLQSQWCPQPARSASLAFTLRSSILLASCSLCASTSSRQDHGTQPKPQGVFVSE